MYFYGDLVQGKELDKVARQRKKKYHEITVSQGERASYIEQGWRLKKELKNRVRLYKDKQCDELLEDEVWLLFKNMGFTEMNQDRNFKIQAGATTKQIDVFAKDENNVFIVECKASVEGARVLGKDIREISDLKKDIADSIRNQYKNRDVRVSFIIATQGMRWTERNQNLAENKKVFDWEEAELQYYGELAKHLGKSTKFQLYSILFRGRKAPDLANIKVPAIYAGRGGAKYYSFVIQPEKLLRVAYVHQRRATPKEILDSYQRMLNRARLDKIGRFISKGGYFPNNIIINFTKKPRFDRKAKEGDIVYGILTFPPYYASAWVIDGQHRLYGYANNEKKMKDTVAVLAFESLDVKEQAKLFVEINREQKAVASNLLWDLYPVIYRDSEEVKQQLQQTISLIVRKLNLDSDSPLCDHIKIPSMPTKGAKITNLTMATICDALAENRLVDRDEDLLYEDDYDSTVDFASERLKAYFSVISHSFLKDWKKGNQGLLRTNIGIRILFIILRSLLRYLKYKGLEGIYKKKDLTEFKEEIKKTLNPVLTKLIGMSDEDRSEIRKQTGKGRVLNNAQRMAWWIKEEFEGFGLELLRNWAPPVPSDESDENIRSLLENTEVSLRAFICKELRSLYGEPWWRQGIPEEIKDYTNARIEDRARREPLQRDALRSLPPDKKMDYTTTPHLRKIIEYSPNWSQFEPTFVKDKGYTLAQFKSFEIVRDTYQHYREKQCDEITKKLGYWGMKWIRRCIGSEKTER